MELLLVLSLALVLLGLATWAHYLFWSRKLFVPTTEDELIHVDTSDGWRLALGRRHGKGVRAGLFPPVLLVHGVSANRGFLDLGIERWSLSAYLAEAGFECFALDLRGHGGSRPIRRDAPRAWSFDDYVRRDLVPVLDEIGRITGQEKVIFVGHSQGGMLGMAACALHPGRVAMLVAIGTPAWFPEVRRIPLLVRTGIWIATRVNRFLARCVAPFVGVWRPRSMQIAIDTRNVSRPVLRALLSSVVDQISPGEVRQFAHWVKTGTFTSMDGAVDYRAGLEGCEQPALFIAGEGDLLAPPSVVERATMVWGGESKMVRIAKATGASWDYGHSDLVLGKAAPEEVFPRVRDWLLERASEDDWAAEVAGLDVVRLPGQKDES